MARRLRELRNRMQNRGLRPWANITRLRACMAVLGTTTVVSIVAALAGADALSVACITAIGVFCFGVALWWFGDKAWDEIGRAIMVAVLLAVVVGVPQYLIDRQQKQRDARAESAQKDRDFKLSLTLQSSLRGADLRNVDLSDVRLWGKDLRDADLRGSRLVNARLVGADLRGANLARADVRRADLRDAHLQGAYLRGTKLARANLQDADMAGTTLAAADLRGASLEDTGLKGSCMAGANLRGARLAGADMAGAVLTAANLQGAHFETDLKPARIGYAGLARAKTDSGTKWPLDFQRHADAVAGRPRAVRAPPSRPSKAAFSATVTNVSDGDTLLLAPDGKKLPALGRARLIGVDAPITTTPEGRAATRFVIQRLLGQRVTVEVGDQLPLDKRSRNLVYIWQSGTRTFNEVLLYQGLAALRTGINKRFADALSVAELYAKQRGIGLWQHCPEPRFTN